MTRHMRSRTITARKRESQWIQLCPTTTASNVAAATSVLIGSLSAGALALRPFTVVRTRFQAWWAGDQVAASEEPFAALGLIVVSDQASAAGVASIPSPISDADGDWFVYENLQSSVLFATASGFSGSEGKSSAVDSKAMRKVGPNEDIAVVVENGSSVFGGQIIVCGRMLVKLH